MTAALPTPSLREVSTVSAGFGEENRPDDYPDPRVLLQLLQRGVQASEIWRTVVAWNTWGRERISALESWASRVDWVLANAEEVARAFRQYDDELASSRHKHLILFDALDRSAKEWRELKLLIRGLLETLLEFRTYKAIRAKAFVRPDMLGDPQVTAFRDASKIIASKVELRWAKVDLYGLLFQYLGNAPGGGEAFRQGCEALGSGAWTKTGTIWQVPRSLREDESLQRRVFDEIAGKWMGRDHRRGFPYTWLPSHLADAAEQVSPRSFLAAIRTAAQSSHGSNWNHALYYEAIKTGVQEASRIRVEEVKEDFFWVQTLMEPLKGLVIPCAFDEIRDRWQTARVIEKLERQDGTDAALLPKHLDEGFEGLRDDLLELALFSRQKDGRINMPDVYRVGFGLGRMGGVRPIR